MDNELQAHLLPIHLQSKYSKVQYVRSSLLAVDSQLAWR